MSVIDLAQYRRDRQPAEAPKPTKKRRASVKVPLVTEAMIRAGLQADADLSCTTSPEDAVMIIYQMMHLARPLDRE